MADDTDVGDGERLAPNDAFAALGNETRVEILRALGEADEPLSFSSLHDHTGMRDSAQFNYHLGRLVGHFVEKTDEGYGLSRAGERVVEAVLSGAVTEAPVLEPTRIEEPCHLCGAPVVVQYRESRLDLYCTECSGTYGGSFRPPKPDVPPEYGFLGGLAVPPAGRRGRTPEELFRAAWTWGNLEILSVASGICPRCSAAVDYDVSVCADHDASEGLCPDCENRYAVYLTVECTNCVLDTAGGAILRLVAHTALFDLLTDHGHNPVAPESIATVAAVHGEYEEDVRSTDPFEVWFTFRLAGEELTLAVDENLDVTRLE